MVLTKNAIENKYVTLTSKEDHSCSNQIKQHPKNSNHIKIQQIERDRNDNIFNDVHL